MSLRVLQASISEDYLSQISCPISQEIMTDPIRVDCPEDHTFDRKFIEQWSTNNNTCPLCRAEVHQDRFRPNRAIRAMVEMWQKMQEGAPSLEGRIGVIESKEELPEKPLAVPAVHLKSPQKQACESKADAPMKDATNPIVSLVVTSKDWAVASTINLPPYPQELQNFLAENCTIWPGKKRSETHIVVPLFPMVSINDAAPIPLTLESLKRLDKSSGGPGYRRLWDYIPEGIPAEKEFHYAVMTNDVIPGSRENSDEAKLLPAGYEEPGVLDATRAILWENRRSKMCFGYRTYTLCKEVILGDCLVVGGFDHSGLCVVRASHCGCGSLGVAGWRKF